MSVEQLNSLSNCCKRAWSSSSSLINDPVSLKIKQSTDSQREDDFHHKPNLIIDGIKKTEKESVDNRKEVKFDWQIQQIWKFIGLCGETKKNIYRKR